MVSRGGRYIQYRATLAAAAPTVSPLLEQVGIGYDVDDVGPRTIIEGVDVADSTANVRFSSPVSRAFAIAASAGGSAGVLRVRRPRALGLRRAESPPGRRLRAGLVLAVRRPGPPPRT